VLLYAFHTNASGRILLPLFLNIMVNKIILSLFKPNKNFIIIYSALINESEAWSYDIRRKRSKNFFENGCG
jgi:hypothetical protein